MVSASAPGKAILLGEHAVVYGQPAIAVPVNQVRATARVVPERRGSGLTVDARDIGRRVPFDAASPDDPLGAAVRHTLAHLNRPAPDVTIVVSSTIPIASGLGSGAAVSTAIVRALARFLGVELDPAAVSRLVYEVEKLHHGTPSGIDNTVIAYEQPVYFVRDRLLETFHPGAPFRLLVADSGAPSHTREVVAAVRAGWQADPQHFEHLFTQVGQRVEAARAALDAGDVPALGPLMDQNHALLVQMGVSSPPLERLVEAARRAGAAGAKLSGAGRGGNIIALVDAHSAAPVQAALLAAGARQVLHTLGGV
ncbi:MAG: mevalonate kinase [Anaerolineae bacterium]|nr:mevalonate kinase [Anaerolineae bacterium]